MMYFSGFLYKYMPLYTLLLIPADPAAWTFDVNNNHFSIVASDILFCDVNILQEPVWYPAMAHK